MTEGRRYVPRLLQDSAMIDADSRENVTQYVLASDYDDLCVTLRGVKDQRDTYQIRLAEMTKLAAQYRGLYEALQRTVLDGFTAPKPQEYRDALQALWPKGKASE